ncbi:MAG: hypothetical protein H6843_17040 [Rhodospirillaceae bacterium]|nr:hypothetical protein [Rhodospirillaceae bacterium]
MTDAEGKRTTPKVEPAEVGVPAADTEDVYDEDQIDDSGPADGSGRAPPASLAGIRIRPSRPRTLQAARRTLNDGGARTQPRTGMQPPPATEAKPLARVVPRPLEAPGRAQPVRDAATRADAAATPPVRRDDPPVRREDPPVRREDPPVRREDPSLPAAENPPTPRPQRRSLDPVRRASANLRGYWDRLRFGRRCPAWSDMDRDQIAFFWPNSILLTCAPEGAAAKRGRTIRSANRIADMTGGVTPDADLSFSETMIAWVLATGETVAEIGEPVEDSDSFPVAAGAEDYTLLALPLIDDGADHVTHVLCHVRRS